MTEPRTPVDPGGQPNPTEAAATEASATEAAAIEPPTMAPTANASGGDSPTDAWPTLTPSSETGPSAASWASPAASAAAAPEMPSTLEAPATPEAPPAESAIAPPPGHAAPPDEPTLAASPYEPADRLPEGTIGMVGEAHTFGETVDGRPIASSRSRPWLRWVLALIGIVVVIGATALIVFLAGGRPATSLGVGYMPATTVQYSEVRLDLPGDQGPKLAAFLANFPGFKDQSQIQPKLDDVFDRIVRAATSGKQTYTADIAPWFGGQISLGSGLPSSFTAPGIAASPPSAEMMGASNMLIVIGIKDKARAEAWLATVLTSSTTKDTYNGTDIWTEGTGTLEHAVAVTDKVMLAGTVDGVRAAIDTKGQGALADDADFKAALAQVDHDYVALTLTRTRPYIDAVTKMVEFASPGILAGSQLDETIAALIPAWQVSTGRFENDEFVTTATYPSLPIGHDATNRKSTLLDHVPAKTIFYAESHDVGPGLTALLAKFRALPETKAAFAQFDQAMSLVGGFDAVAGWWGDAAVVVAPGADGVIGGGLLVKPSDKVAADRLFTTLRGFLALAGSSTGVNIHDEDHNGTPIVILDFSAVPGMTLGSLPPGYKAEVAYAVTNDVVVLGYGRDFVASVLDAAPGSNLASDDRFKNLLSRVGEENIGLSFLDVNAIRGLAEPVFQKLAPADIWATYEKEIKPYVEHVDALISSSRKDGALDRSQAALTAR